MSQEALLI